MRESAHHSINALLRTAMADIIGGKYGGWGVLGCYWKSGQLDWVNLIGVNEALADRLTDRIADGTITHASVYAAVAALATEIPDDACGTDLRGLRGLALVGNVADPENGPVSIADAALEDGWRHVVSWYVEEAAPQWQLFSPADQARSEEPLPQTVPDLLEAMRRTPCAAPEPPWPGSLDREQHEQLNGVLRGLVAADMSEEDPCNGVYLIRRDNETWQVEAAYEMTLRIAVYMGEDGLAEIDAIARVAQDLRDQDDPALPGLCGIAVLVHRPRGDSLTSGVSAVCDDIFHVVVWPHHAPAPEWEIDPIEGLEPDLKAHALIYRSLLHAITSTD